MQLKTNEYYKSSLTGLVFKVLDIKEDLGLVLVESVKTGHKLWFDLKRAKNKLIKLSKLTKILYENRI